MIMKMGKIMFQCFLCFSCSGHPTNLKGSLSNFCIPPKYFIHAQKCWNIVFSLISYQQFCVDLQNVCVLLRNFYLHTLVNFRIAPRYFIFTRKNFEIEVVFPPIPYYYFTKLLHSLTKWLHSPELFCSLTKT